MKQEEAKSVQQYGVQYPDGSLAWAETDGVRKGTIGVGSAQIDDPVGRAKFAEDYRQTLRGIGVEPSRDLRLRFVERTVTTSFSEWVEVEDA